MYDYHGTKITMTSFVDTSGLVFDYALSNSLSLEFKFPEELKWRMGVQTSSSFKPTNSKAFQIIIPLEEAK